MQRQTLADQVIQHIKDMIESQGLGPGNPIPSETEIAKELGVSRGIVREAYHSLTASGLIVVSSGRRPHVGELQSRVFESFFSHAQMTGQTDMLNLMTLRMAIEVAASGMAAKNRSYLHLHRMKNALDKMVESVGQTEAFVKNDFDFHLILLEASNNVLFELVVKGLRQPVYEAMKTGMFNHDTEEGRMGVLNVHENVFLAVEKGDSDASELAMKKHYEFALSHLKKE